MGDVLVLDGKFQLPCSGSIRGVVAAEDLWIFERGAGGWVDDSIGSVWAKFGWTRRWRRRWDNNQLGRGAK